MKNNPIETRRDEANSEAAEARRGDRAIAALARLPWWPALRGYLALWHRLEIAGRENLPVEPPFVMVSNHSSHLDALVLAAALPKNLREQTQPIAAGDTFFSKHPIAKFAAAVMHARPVRRDYCGRHAMAALRLALTEMNQGFILFPEGTRSRSGLIGRFLPGVGVLVAGTSTPVVPCHITGSYHAMPPGNFWPMPGKVTLRIGAPMVFDHLPNERSGWNGVAEQVESAVRRLGAQPHRASRRRTKPALTTGR